jgi:hypothetical protein
VVEMIYLPDVSWPAKAGHPVDAACLPMDGPVLPGHDTEILFHLSIRRSEI